MIRRLVLTSFVAVLLTSLGSAPQIFAQKIVTTIPEAGGSMIAINPNTGRVYGCTRDGMEAWIEYFNYNFYGSGIYTDKANLYVVNGASDSIEATLSYFLHPLYFVRYPEVTADSIYVRPNFRVPPQDVAVNPVTNRIYVTTGQNWFSIKDFTPVLWVIDGNTNALITRILLSTVGRVDEESNGAHSIAVNPVTNKVYVTYQELGKLIVIDGVTNTIEASLEIGSGWIDRRFVTVNPTTNRVYVASTQGMLQVFDGTPTSPTYNTVIANLQLGEPKPIMYYNQTPPAFLDVNTRTNRIYISKTLDNTVYVVDGNTNQLVAAIPVGTTSISDIAVNSSTNRIYVINASSVLGRAPFLSAPDDIPLSVIDGNCNTVVATYPVNMVNSPWGVAINPHNNLLYVTDNKTNSVSVIDPTANDTPIGPGAIVQNESTKLIFNNVSSPGTTKVTPIDPAIASIVPGGYALSNSQAYEISTAAGFAPPVTIAFSVPCQFSEADFNNLIILQNENGTLIDVTADRSGGPGPARNYGTGALYAVTNSLSQFYLARKGQHILPLFDQTKAYKSGSTIPVKLQLLNQNNLNVSSASTVLTTRELKRVSNNTTAAVLDSGNANPDNHFRYDATIGGYIYNLSTKELATGAYVLSFYVGNDRSFLYTVKFEIK